MKFLFVFTLILSLFQVDTFGQFDIDPDDAASMFNPEIIRKEGIRSVTASYSIKYDLEKIRKTRKRFIYYFNDAGYVNKVIEIYPNRSSEDSVVTWYYRQKDGLISTKVRTDNRITQVELMEYDDDDLVKHYFYQMGRTSNWNDNLYSKYIIWADSLVKNDFGIGVYNRWDVMYKSYQIDKNEDQNITRFATYSRSKQLQQERNYVYSGSRLIEISEENRNKYMFNWKKIFTYSVNGIEEIKYFKKDELSYLRKIHYLDNGLLELDLKRNESTKKMTIVKFTYSRN